MSSIHRAVAEAPVVASTDHARRQSEPFAKLILTFITHPKVIDLSDQAVGVWTRGIGYAGLNRTDGFLPTIFLRRFCGKSATRAAKELVGAGLWEVVDGGWRIHDYLDYQQSRQHIEENSAKRAIAGSKGGKARGGQSSSKLPSNEQADCQAEEEVDEELEREVDVEGERECALSRGPIARPMPDSASSTNNEPPSRRGSLRFEADDWSPNAKHRRLAAELELDMEFEADRFRDHVPNSKNGYYDLDAGFSAWLRREVKLSAWE